MSRDDGLELTSGTRGWNSRPSVGIMKWKTPDVDAWRWTRPSLEWSSIKATMRMRWHPQSPSAMNRPYRHARDPSREISPPISSKKRVDTAATHTSRHHDRLGDRTKHAVIDALVLHHD